MENRVFHVEYVDHIDTANAQHIRDQGPMTRHHAASAHITAVRRCLKKSSSPSRPSENSVVSM
jgi:hypothetical protein